MEALENGGDWKSGRKKLTVEGYLDFIDDRTLPLTGNQLRQIIGMHGFKKIEVQKTILTEMVTSMELMDLHRSTLLDGGASGDACLTLGEVITDLKYLNWQDCHVTSLLAYGAGGTASSAIGNWTTSRKRKRLRGSRKRAVKGAVGTTTVTESTTEMSVC